MVPDRIKELLDKYWQAETDEAEEAELKKYFVENPDVHDHPAAALFTYFKEEQQVPMPGSLNEKFNTVINTKPHTVKWMGPFLKVAAVLLIVFSVVYFLLPDKKPAPVAATEVDTYDDPQKAYLETKKALLLVSRRLNTGTLYITEISKINKPEQLLNTKK